MDIKINKNDSATVVIISGKVDAVTAPKLEESLNELIDQGETRIILDLDGIRYISSAGLRVLLATTQALYKKGKFALCSIPDDVMEIIDMVGFSKIMNIYRDVEEAERNL